MDQLNSFQQQNNLNVITGDIGIAERKLEKLHKEIEELEDIKKVETKEVKARLAVAKKAVQTAEEENKRLEIANREIKEENIRVKRDTEIYGNNEVKKAEEAVGAIYTKAQETNKEADERNEKSKVWEAELVIREATAKETQELSTKQIAENSLEKARLAELSTKITEQEKQANKTVVEAQEKVHTLDRDAATKTARNKGLDITIRIKEAIAKRTEEEAKAKLVEATRVLAEAKAMKEANEKEKENLNTAWIVVNDRTATLKRGFDELRAKGGDA